MSGRPRGAEILYGRNAVIEALRGRRKLYRLLLAPGVERQPRVAALLREAQRRSIPIQRLAHNQLDELLGSVNHQGIALETSPYPYRDLAAILARVDRGTIVALDHVQDPQNLGTLMRTAEAVGVVGLILPDRRAAAITPAVVNASAGAVEHLSVAPVANLSRAVEECKAAGYWALALEAGEQIPSLYQLTLPEPLVLVIGSEGKGISPGVLRHADLRAQLPMRGAIASLNAAVAGSIALYEILRRQVT